MEQNGALAKKEAKPLSIRILIDDIIHRKGSLETTVRCSL